MEMSKSFDDSDSASDMSPSTPTNSTSVLAGIGSRSDDVDGDASGVGIGAATRATQAGGAQGSSSRLSSSSTTKRARRVKERLRITHACERCKYKKARCNGDQPVCGNCSKSKTECVYQPELDGRKRKKLTRTTLPARSSSSSSPASQRIMNSSRDESWSHHHQGSAASASEPSQRRPRSSSTAANQAHGAHGPSPEHDRPTSDPTGAFASTSADDADSTVRSPLPHHHTLPHHHPHSAGPSHHRPHQLPPPHPHHLHHFEPDGQPDLPGDLVDPRWTPSHHHASSGGGNLSVDRLSLPPEHFHHSPHQPLPHMSLLNLENPILPAPTGPGWPMVSPHQISPSIDHGQYHEHESPYHHQQQPLHPHHSLSHSHPHSLSHPHPHSHSQPHHQYPPHQDQNQHHQQQQHSEQQQPQQQQNHEQQHQRSEFEFHHNPPVLPSYIRMMGPNHPHATSPILCSVLPMAGGQLSALSPSPSPPPHHHHHQLHHSTRHHFAHPSQEPPSSIEAERHHAGVGPGASGGSLDQLSALAAERHRMEGYRPMGRPIEFNYLRPFGPTAMQPGLQQVHLSLSSVDARDPMMRTPGPRHLHRRISYPLAQQGSHHFRDPGAPSHLYAPGSDIPRQDVLDDLVPLFFLRMGSDFPFLNVRHVQEACGQEPLGTSSHPTGWDSGSSSAQLDGPLLVNTICAVAARFSEASSIVQLEQDPGTWGIAFADKAKQLLTPLLGLPSSGTVASLLLLAHHEFGLNSEGALWMYTGMAVRMAQDIGLHLNIRRPTSDRRKRAQDSLLWWSCVTMDRMLSIGTGRTSMAKEHEVFLPAPTDEDIQVVAQDVAVPNLHSLLPSPFPHHVALQRLVGQLADIVNATSTIWGSSMEDNASADADREPTSAEPSYRLAGAGTEHGADDLYAIEHEIRTLYHNLPRDLGWSNSNFRRQIARGTVPMYLHLHLWYHAIIIILYRTPVLHPKLNAAKPALTDRLRQSIVSSACDSIREVLVVSDTIDAARIASCPFVHQPLFIAALAWAQEYRLRTGRNILSAPSLNSHAQSQVEGNNEANGSSSGSGAGSDILAIEASKNYHFASSALARQSQFWLGVRGIVKLLERHAIGAAGPSSGEGMDHHVRPIGSQVLLTLCSENEMGILARLNSRKRGGSDGRDETGSATPSLASTTPQSAAANRDNEHRHRPSRPGEQETVDALFGMLHPPTSMLGGEGGVLGSSNMNDNTSPSNANNNRPPTNHGDSAPNSSARVDLTHDAFALAYTFASSLPTDGAARSGPASAPAHDTQPSAPWR